MTPQEASAYFEKKYREQIAFWIDEGSYLSDKSLASADWLSFRGAFLFEQYPATEDVPDVQWPLVSACQYYADKTTYSLLEIGSFKTSPLFRFNLNLPLPTPRTRLSQPWRNVEAFPFSAIYSPISRTSTIEFDTLVGGWVAATSSGGGKPTKTSFVFENDKLPGQRLGTFGFSASGVFKHGFAIYANEDGVEMDRHWPRFKWLAFTDVLSRYGFDVGTHQESPIDTKNDGPIDLSLRFLPVVDNRSQGGGFASGLVFRVAVTLPAKKVADQDLKFGGSVFTEFLHLRMREELAGEFGNDVQIAVPAEDIEGWLHIGKTAYLDCEVKWEIASEDVWTHDKSLDWTPLVSIRISWQEEISKGTLDRGVEPKNHFSSGLLDAAGYSLNQTRRSLLGGEAGLPHSFLPNIENLESQNVRFVLHGEPIQGQIDDAGVLHWGTTTQTAENLSAGWKRPPMRLGLASDSDRLGGNVPRHRDEGLDSLKLRAANFTFFRDTQTEMTITLSPDCDWRPASAGAIQSDDQFFASYSLKSEISNEWSGRLASIHFVGSNSIIDESEDGRLRVGGSGQGASSTGIHLVYPIGRVAVELRLFLPVNDITPISIDTDRMDRSGRAAPLLIPLPNAPIADKQAKAASYYLTAVETISPRRDRLLKAFIDEKATSDGNKSYVVLSAEPFSIYRFTNAALSDRGDALSSEVATYSSDQRIWQYKKVSEHYRYSYPPQSVGESADKPRRLEIHDLPDGSTENPPRPFLLNLRDDGALDEELSGRRRRAVEYRLTPSTDIWIRPNDLERSYFMPEQSSYEIFRQSNAYGLGAALAYLRGEFLYGMPVGIDVSKESSISRAARITEIEALTGRLAGPAVRTSEINLSNRWNALRNSVATRPERLEIWANDPQSAVDFTPARFSDGVSFALRHTAVHRAPVIQIDGDFAREDKEDYNAFPRVGGLSLGAAEPLEKPRHHPQGLSGGAIWPVESVNLFRILLDTPESNGGAIEGISLSPHGGDATQRAEFLGGKVTIISQTRNGRVERQQVEVLGRICAFWHRAKHVVVYERTVNPSAQFAPKADEHPETRSRRPILRKVREYIELLQPERGYPDFSTATPRSTGFLEKVRFNSKVINVDSAWATEVGQSGWQIPLWHRGSARERPQVYPMPDCVFVTTAEGDGDKPVASQACLDPDYLFFFADFLATTSDTNLWEPRLDLDYPNMPTSQEISKAIDVKSSSDPASGGEGRRPNVSRFLPGLRRFTWRLAPASQKTAVNAGRSATPVYVGLDTVTFMRATHQADAQKSVEWQSLEKLLNPKINLDTERSLSRAYWESDGTGFAVDSAQTFAKYFSPSSELLLAIKERRVSDLHKEWLGLAQDLWPDLSDKIANGFNDIKDGDFSGYISPVPSQKVCAKLKTDAVGVIKRKTILTCQALSDWVADSDKLLGELIDKSITKKELIDGLSRDAIDYIRPIFREASQDVASVSKGIEVARGVILDFSVEIEGVLKRARDRVEQFVAGYDQNKPWSDERRAAFRQGFQVCLSSISGDIDAAIDEARTRLATELNSVTQAIGGHVSLGLKAFSIAATNAQDSIATVQGLIDRFLSTFEDYVLAETGQLGILKGRVAEALEDKTYEPLRKAMLAALDVIIDKSRNAATTARAVAATVDTAADKAVGEIEIEKGEVKAANDRLFADLDADLTYFLTEQFKDDLENLTDLKDDIEDSQRQIEKIVADITREVDVHLKQIDTAVKALLLPTQYWLAYKLDDTDEKLAKVTNILMAAAKDAGDSLAAVQSALAPEALFEKVVAGIVAEAFTFVISPLPDPIAPDPAAVAAVRGRLGLLAEEVGSRIQGISADALSGVEAVSQVCETLNEGVAEVADYLSDIKQRGVERLQQTFDALDKEISGLTVINDAEGLLRRALGFERNVRGVYNDLSRACETARAFAHRAFDAFSRLDEGGVLAAPCNILKLYSAVTSAPEIASLKADIDRIRAGFDEFADIVDTTKANALFNQLGDELKALGISLPFDKISDRLLAADLSDFDIGKVFRNFGGLKLDKLFNGYRIPSGVREAVKISHDFDKERARAWVQIDIDAPMPGRRTLFSFGSFKTDFVDMRLTGRVRLEASKDQSKVTQTGFGRIGTTIDTVVSGQSMVRFEKFGLNFSKEKGLDIEFDPKNIRLNPSLQFIQDFLGTIFPDEIGGLKVVKQDGIPVGVEHEFLTPNLSLNFGTSGVSNISIQNRFKLLAYPNFVISNQFNVSTLERPFIFSIFIIGGTGYVQIESEYQPLRNQLSVVVDAGAGGSAALAFAFGPFSGQVFITLSAVLSYRKLTGNSGGGLSVSVVLVIAGQVDVSGIVTVGVTILLRLSYRDSGQIDADGQLTVTIRISSFFKLTARANVKYKLRGGKSETAINTSTSAEGEIAQKAQKLREAADRLQGARN
ncbi:hypothetical protein [Rhizobium sp. X9]|uniref:hypothetical protein n=1 Tax=Rhizobium sp. X9 TaxID=2815360 RepID=UPI001C0E87C2|nr:hypothetical protein [Rhizobium sp. X9]